MILDVARQDVQPVDLGGQIRGQRADAAVVVGAFYALRPLPVPVDTAVIDRGALSVTIDEEGKTRIREVFMVSAPVAGKMLRAPLEVGDKVIAGRTIVSVIEPTSPTFLDVRSRRELQAVVAAASTANSMTPASGGKLGPVIAALIVIGALLVIFVF